MVNSVYNFAFIIIETDYADRYVTSNRIDDDRRGGVEFLLQYYDGNKLPSSLEEAIERRLACKPVNTIPSAVSQFVMN